MGDVDIDCAGSGPGASVILSEGIGNVYWQDRVMGTFRIWL